LWVDIWDSGFGKVLLRETDSYKLEIANKESTEGKKASEGEKNLCSVANNNERKVERKD
jgi:hypothetical protein